MIVIRDLMFGNRRHTSFCGGQATVVAASNRCGEITESDLDKGSAGPAFHHAHQQRSVDHEKNDELEFLLTVWFFGVIDNPEML